MSRSHGYPRPMLERPEWVNLNGPWDFAIDTDAKWNNTRSMSNGKRRFLYLSLPETPASGIGNTGFFRAVWYRRTFEYTETRK